MRVFFYYIHWSACDARIFQHLPSQWGHKYINYISRTALRVTSQACYHFIWIKPASYHSYTHTHGNVKVFTATRQNKSSFLLKRHCARNILLLFSRMYVILLLLLNLYFDRNNHTIFLPYFNFNSKSPLFTKKLNVFKLLIKRQIKFGWNLFTVFHTLLLAKKLETILNKYKQWHWFFDILFLFDFINKNSMFLISMFLCFALVPKLVPRTVDFHWYRYRILKFWYRDNPSSLCSIVNKILAYVIWKSFSYHFIQI